MRRTILTLLIFFFGIEVYAQIDSARIKLARVNVTVTDFKGKPSRGEQILFRSSASQSIFGGISDSAGQFSLQLQAGDKYIITIKRIIDTTQYGILDIPALPKEEFYTHPFKVNVKVEVSKTYTLDDVHFDFGKATLRPDSFAELDELVSYLRRKGNIHVEIGGHTDNVGKEPDNLRLSQQRADAIRNFVIAKGIDAARVFAKGYGSAKPVADNTTDEGRQLNRRTEVRIL